MSQAEPHWVSTNAQARCPGWLAACARKRIAVTWVVGILLAGSVIARGFFAIEHDGLCEVSHWLGLVLIGAGLALRSWAAAMLHKEHSLCVAGPYALCRHPLYLGTLLLFSGFGFEFHDPATGVVLTAAFAALYWPTMCVEERKLAHLHGPAWQAYSAKTARLLPFCLPCGIGPVSWNRWLQNHEYRAMLGSLIGLLAIHGCLFLSQPQ